jgi:hypothetical protein
LEDLNSTRYKQSAATLNDVISKEIFPGTSSNGHFYRNSAHNLLVKQLDLNLVHGTSL